MSLEILMIRLAVPIIAACALVGCDTSGRSTPTEGAAVTAPAALATRSKSSTAVNTLQLKLDGREWHADRAIEAMVDPPGFDHMLIISGSYGPKDRNEQAFNLNLTGVQAPGRYVIKGGNAVGSAIQLANLSPERFLIGGTLGADVVIEVTTLQRAPVAVEGRFSGTMTANDGTALRVEDGRFSYRE